MLLAFLLSSVSLRNLCVESGLKLKLVESVHHVSTNIINAKTINVLHSSKKKNARNKRLFRLIHFDIIYNYYKESSPRW